MLFMTIICVVLCESWDGGNFFANFSKRGESA